jgi:tight adherence protein B
MKLFLFVFMVVAVNGAYLLLAALAGRRERKQYYRRLGIEAHPQRIKGKVKAALIGLGAGENEGSLDRWLRRIRVRDGLETLLEQAGSRVTVAQFARRTLAAVLVGGVAGTLLASGVFPWSALIGAIAAGALPYVAMRRALRKRLESFEIKFPSCLEFISRSMRAGHAFSVTMELIQHEFQGPLAAEFKRAYEEHNLGMPLELALQKVAKRVPLLSVQFFVCAVTLQKKTGGNLAEILEKLAEIVRERFKLKARVRVISAHGRLTAIALGSIPAVVAGMMFLVNGPYMRFFIDEVSGHWLTAVALVMQVAGYLVIRKMVRIEV